MSGDDPEEEPEDAPPGGLYQRITWARKLLGLGETATLAELDGKARALLKQWHPDHCREAPALCHRRTQELLAAHRLLREYCGNYRYSFSREEVEKYLSPEEWWRKRFGMTPNWPREGGSLDEH